MSDTAEQACPGATGGDPSPLSFSDPLRDAWAELLGRYSWQWFCTLTFRDAIHPEAASKRFRYWVRLLNNDVHGPNWKRNRAAGGGVHWICALEWQKRGVLHFHALLGNTRNLNEITKRSTYADLWNELAGFARIDVIDNERAAVCAYVAKYVSKGGEIDLAENIGNADFWKIEPEASARRLAAAG